MPRRLLSRCTHLPLLARRRVNGAVSWPELGGRHRAWPNHLWQLPCGQPPGDHQNHARCTGDLCLGLGEQHHVCFFLRRKATDEEKALAKSVARDETDDIPAPMSPSDAVLRSLAG